MMVPRHLAGVSIIIWILCGHKGAVFPLVVHVASCMLASLLCVEGFNRGRLGLLCT